MLPHHGRGAHEAAAREQHAVTRPKIEPLAEMPHPDADDPIALRHQRIDLHVEARIDADRLRMGD